MDPLKNPFSPGAGAPPPELVGRDSVLSQARILLGRVRQKKPEKSLLLTGLRGVGKTVLLNEIVRIAESDGYRTISIEAHDEKPLGLLLAPQLRTVLYDLNRIAGAIDKVKRGLAVLRSFVSGLKVKVDDISFSLDIEPETGTADSGDLEVDLPALLVAIGEAAEDRRTAVGLFIDELQYLTSKELSALIMAMHKMQQRQLPVVLLGAGLPTLPALAGESKSYAERLFNFPDIGALSFAEANAALSKPIRAAGAVFLSAGIIEIYRLTDGYPYFIQEWGYRVWNYANQSQIGLADVEAITPNVIHNLDRNFFRVRFDRLTHGEKNVLRAMAELGVGPHQTGDIGTILKRSVTSLAPVRAKLIKKGMIYSPAHGKLAFTVPQFDQFMVRAIPEFKSS